MLGEQSNLISPTSNKKPAIEDSEKVEDDDDDLLDFDFDEALLDQLENTKTKVKEPTRC
jgi:hypothetical protein